MTEQGILRDVLQAARTSGVSMNDLTVLGTQNDPYRLDTPAGHRDAKWFEGRARIKGCVKREDIAGPQGASSRPMWETLEGMVREKAQEFIQQIMEEEVTELLGREKSERRSTVDSAEGYRNGYGKPRRLAMSSGTITLRRPRVRGVEERFESRVLPLFARRVKGGVGPEIGLPRVGRVLVGGVAGSEGTRHRGAPASDGGR